MFECPSLPELSRLLDNAWALLALEDLIDAAAMKSGRLGYLGQREASGLRTFKALAPLTRGSVELALFPFVARLSALGIIARFALGGVGHWKPA